MKKMKSLKPLLPFVGLFVFLGCTNDTPVSSRFDLVGNNEVGLILQAEVPQPQVDSTAGKIINNGLSPLLQLGAFNNTESKILIRFSSFPAGATVRSASLILPTHHFLGDAPDFEATAHRVTSDWQDTTVTNDNFNDAFDPAIIGRQMVAAKDSDSVFVALDNALVSGWIGGTTPNYGVLVQAPSATFAKQFHSRNSALGQPILRLAYTNNNVDSTKDVSAASDAFIFKVLLPPPVGPLYITHGTDFNSLLKFDLTSFPPEATVNRAQLILTVDLANTHLTSDQMALRLMNIGKNSIDPLTATKDSTFQIDGIVVSDSTANVVFEIRAIMQSWLRAADDPNRLKNFGVVLEANSPDIDLQQLAIESKESNPALAPKLKIDYTLPPRIQ